LGAFLHFLALCHAMMPSRAANTFGTRSREG
jgi:hypothetical protein